MWLSSARYDFIPLKLYIIVNCIFIFQYASLKGLCYSTPPIPRRYSSTSYTENIGKMLRSSYFTLVHKEV